MADLTVGYVAGLIALAIFIAQLWTLNSLAFLLAGILKDNETAATWTVVSRALHSSNWPTVLRSDSARSAGVRRPVAFLTLAMPLTAVLVAIAGVVTPLGLYESIETTTSQSPQFTYVRDISSFGLATGPPNKYNLSRICSSGHGIFSQGPAPCPYSNNTIVFSWDGETYTWEFTSGSYTSKVPQIVRDIYSSGTAGLKTTVSNFFDIRWRQVATKTQKYVDNGTAYAVDNFRMVDSLVLTDSYKVVEGLVVDARQGGVGLRNHTVPMLAPGILGADWTEDLLFIEPETVCVDTNLTLDWTASDDSHGMKDLVLRDNGGFVGLDHTYPQYDHDNAQFNADLYRRAYKAAWLNNVWTMAFLNVTSLNNDTMGTKAFAYLNSTLGRTFNMTIDILEPYKALGLHAAFGFYLPLSSSALSGGGKYPNPFKVNAGNFSAVTISCAGAGAADLSNSSNIYVACGLLRGAPHRLDPKTLQPLPDVTAFFDPGSRWSSNLHSCAAAVRATIKTVGFHWNATANSTDAGVGVGGLSVTSITPKQYPGGKDTMPLWAMEESGLDLDGISPVWGIIAPPYDTFPNLSSFRKESFYLPGLSSSPGLPLANFDLGTTGIENLPGSDFPAYTMTTVFSGTIKELPYDVMGRGSLAIFRRWQELSRKASLSGQMINLLWTDLASSAVVGTKGVLGPENGGTSAEPTTGRDATPLVVSVSVAPIVQRIRYHYPFAIPAFLLLLVIFATLAAAFVAAVAGKSSVGAVRQRLKDTSVGRVWRSLVDPARSNLAPQTTKEWADMGNARADVDVALLKGDVVGAAGMATSSQEAAGQSEQAMGMLLPPGEKVPGVHGVHGVEGLESENGKGNGMPYAPYGDHVLPAQQPYQQMQPQQQNFQPQPQQQQYELVSPKSGASTPVISPDYGRGPPAY